MISICMLWGLDFIFAKQALEILNPLFFTAMRFFIIGFALLPFVRKKIFNEIPILFLAGFMIVIVSYGASDISNKLNNSTIVSATLSQMDAILAILMGFFIFREEITYNKIIGVTIAFIGLMSMFIINVFSSQETSNLNSEIQGINWKNLISILITIVGITGWSGYIFFTKRIEEKMTNSEIIAWSSFFGSILCFIILIIFDGF